MGRRETAGHHEQILHELNEERAAALLRISRMLESLIDQLQELRARMTDLDERERARQIAAYRALRRRAVEYRWYLEVQREALGLRHHHRLDEFYTIPGPI